MTAWTRPKTKPAVLKANGSSSIRSQAAKKKAYQGCRGGSWTPKPMPKYPKLTEDEVKALVVDDKWLTHRWPPSVGEMDRISQALTKRVKELAERYETPHYRSSLTRPYSCRAGGQSEPAPGKDGVHMEVRPGYKQTEVGVIPEDWEVTNYWEFD